MKVMAIVVAISSCLLVPSLGYSAQQASGPFGGGAQGSGNGPAQMGQRDRMQIRLGDAPLSALISGLQLSDLQIAEIEAIRRPMMGGQGGMRGGQGGPQQGGFGGPQGGPPPPGGGQGGFGGPPSDPNGGPQGFGPQDSQAGPAGPQGAPGGFPQGGAGPSDQDQFGGPQGGPPPPGGGNGGVQGGFRGPGGGPQGGPQGGFGGPRSQGGPQVDQKIESILTSTQKSGVPQLLERLNLMRSASIPAELYGVLQLTHDQYAALKKLGDGDRQAKHDQAMTILTDAQKADVEAFEKVVGRPGTPPRN